MQRFLTAVAVSVAILFASSSSRAEDVVYHIGIPKCFFREVPPELVAFAGQPFHAIMKEQTGLNGQITQEADAMTVAKKIDEGKLQFGVLQGHEYAWVREKYPALKPLLCSVDRPKEVYAVFLVRTDCKANSLGDRKHWKVALADTLKDYARLFFAKKKSELKDGSELATTKADTVHAGIQSVVMGDADVTVADYASWNYFQKLYPGPSKNLKVLAKSAEFPPTILVYKKGSLPDSVLKTMTDGFRAADKNRKAAILMEELHIERFDAIPKDFDNELKACLKAYPKPLADK